MTVDEIYPTIDEISAAIADQIPIFQAKLNHGFWETWIQVENLLVTRCESPGGALDRKIRRHYFTEGGFLEELKTELNGWLAPPAGPYLSCTSQAFPNDDFLAPLPPTPRDQINAFIQERAPDFAVGIDGLVWKRAVLDGSIVDFLEGLGAQHVVLVGPAHLAVHQTLWGWPNFEMIDIHPTAARGDREEILTRILAAVSVMDFPVVLLQCGSMSAWLVARLFRCGVRGAVLDPGRALDFAAPEIVLSQPWGMAHVETLAHNYCSRIPAWSKWQDQHNVPRPFGTRPPVEIPGQVVQYVEEKQLDFSRLEIDLAASAEAGQWANRGPAVQSLERDIAERLQLTEDVVPIAVSSGTAALWTAAAIAALRHGAPMRWLVSSFGFFSSAVGPLADVKIVDANDQGMLSLELVSALDPDSYDGMIVTDLFGRADILPYLEFAERQGKQLVIDAAAGFDRELYQRLSVPVAFSFHHTKPFGFGEGGCLLVRSEEAEEAYSIANYGHELPDHIASFCGNWKMSDPQAALIAQRHSTAPYWSGLYRLQYERIQQVCARMGINVLASAGSMLQEGVLATPGHIAIVLDRPVSQRALEDLRLPFVPRKYYRPLAPTAKASDLYARIVCIPVHRDMGRLSSTRISEGIESIAGCQEPYI